MGAEAVMGLGASGANLALIGAGMAANLAITKAEMEAQIQKKVNQAAVNAI